MHPKLSGNGLLSSWAVQNRSQNCRSISQSEVILQYMRDPGPPAAWRPKRVNPRAVLRDTKITPTGWSGSRSRLVDEL